MDETTRLVKFSDGTLIVCMVEGVDNLLEKSHIKILYPIEVVSNGIDGYEDNRAMEQYSLKAWMGLSDDVMFTINTKDITVISSLNEEYMVGYENVVNRLYYREDAVQEAASDGEFTPEDLLELIQAKEDNKLN